MSTATARRAAATLDDPRWSAVLARDPGADGHFVYAVRSTGVYCRPSCAARIARPENVEFHSSPAEAERAGFRACKRCRPGGPAPAQLAAARVAEVCRLLDAAEVAPPVDALAARVGLGARQLHRLFRAATGLTPRAWAAARRAERARDALAGGAPVTRALYDAGYASSGRFYAAAGARLGMAPADYRDGGRDHAIRFAVGECSLGAILVAASGRGVCAISLGDDPDALVRALQDRFPHAELVGSDPEFEALVARVVGLVEAPRLGIELPLDLRGTAFQERVWQALRAIPPGETLSYTELARRIGAPRAIRAVAGACAANTLAVAIPCHRVVRSDGDLSGYRWGVARKRALLAREADG